MPTPKYVQAPFAIPQDFAVELHKAGELLDAGNDTQQVGHAILTEVLQHGYDSDYKFVAYFIFTKALKSLQSVQLLCRCGYGSDGLSLCAVLFENLIDLLYIGKAPVRRARRYRQYEQVEPYYQARRVLAEKRLPKGRRKTYRRYERDLLGQVRHLLRYFPSPKNGWSGKSLFDRAKSVKAGLAYRELYWVFCAHKHTLPMAATGLVVTTPSNELSLTTGPDMKGVCHAAEQSTKMFLSICLILDDLFRLSLRSEIENCSTKLREAVAAVKKSHPSIYD
jgi:hypothetical protein